ncbi:MAG: ABC transporter ATP-binding protein, partial [Alphaproteobacteria bacterium]|nr:ABC transporter ATP-binding protein [Alphaproteobacteria bacterium]
MSLITQLSKVVVLEQPPEGISRIPDKLWPFIWFFLRQYRWSFLAIALCFVVSTTLMSSSSYFIKLIVDTLGQTGSRADIITDVFWIFAGYVLLCGVMQSIFWRLAEYFCTYVYPSFTNTVRGQLNVYVNRHSYEYFQNDFAGRLSSKVTETPKAVLALIKEFIEGFVYNAVVFAVSFTLLAMTGLYQLLIMLGVSVLYVVTLRVFLPRVKRLSQMTSDYMSFIRGHHVDMMANILNIKLFSKQKYENKRFFGVLQEGANKYHIKDTQLFKFMCKLDTIMKLIWMLPVAYALYAWQDGITTAGDVAMVMALSIQLGNTMWSFSFTVSNFFENLGQVQEGMETITQALNVQDQPNAPKMDIQNADIRFSNMSFSYGKNGVFEDFNLHIKAGEKVGIVGPSGAGKSSLIQLLLRLYDIQAGEVLI